MLLVVLRSLLFKLLAFLQETGNLCFDLTEFTVGSSLALVVVLARNRQVILLLFPTCSFQLGLMQFVGRYLPHFFNLSNNFGLLDLGLLHALFELANLLPLSFVIASVRRETTVEAVDFLLQIGQSVLVVSLVALDSVSLCFELLFGGLDRVLECGLGR